MKHGQTARLLAALAYLGAIFLIGGHVYARLAAFSGLMPIKKNHAERIAVQPSDENRKFLGMARHMPLDVAGFEDAAFARAVLDDKRLYDAMTLPFRIRVDNIEVLESFPPRDVLVVSGNSERAEHALTDGQPIMIGEAPVEVRLRPWRGLLRQVNGMPMAAVSLREPGSGPWLDRLLLSTEAWLRIESRAGVRLRWHENQEDAAAAQTRAPTTLKEGRWGVVEKPAIHWFNTFTPGTGETLRDGTEVTLLEVTESPRAIVVEFRRGDNRSVQNLEANTADPEGRLRFEWPGAWPSLLFVDAWREGEALFSAYQDGKPCGAFALRLGKSEKVEGFPFEVRLDQVMTSAIPVGSGEGDVREVVLRDSAQEVCLREGESGACNEFRVQYRRVPVPPRVRFTLSAIDKENGVLDTFALAPEEHHRVGEWVFAQEPGFAGAAEAALLRAERTLATPARIIGIAMIVLGSIGWVFTRRRRGDEPIAVFKPLDDASDDAPRK